MALKAKHFIVIAGRECVGGRDPAATATILDKVSEIVGLLEPEPGTDAADTDWAALVKFRAGLQLRRDMVREAITDLGPLVEPRHGSLRRSRSANLLFATALERDGRKMDALTHLQAAVNANSEGYREKPRAFSRLARLYYEVGKKDLAAMAANIYLSAVQIAPVPDRKTGGGDAKRLASTKKHEMIAVGILLAIYGPESKEIQTHLDGLEERHGARARKDAVSLAARWRAMTFAATEALPLTSSDLYGYEDGESPLYRLLNSPFKPVPISNRDRIRTNLCGKVFEFSRCKAA